MSHRSSLFVACLFLCSASAALAQPVGLGKGCTTAWYIDEDCDGYGVGVRSSGIYGGPGLGDRPDADDSSAGVNTPGSVVAAYDVNSNGSLDTSELKTFLSTRKGFAADNVYYISTTGNNDTGQPDNPVQPYANFYGGVRAPGRVMDPGDVVVYQAGTYDEPYLGGTSPSFPDGSPSEPTMAMTAPGAVVVFTSANIAIDMSYGVQHAIIDGFSVDNRINIGRGYGIQFNTAHNLVMRNIESQHFNWITAMQDLQDVTIDRWVVHHNSEHGLYMGSRELPGTNVTVKNSVFYKNGLEAGYGAIQFNGRVTNFVVENNILHSNGNWGVSFKQGVSNSVIRNNLIFNNEGHGIVLDVYPGDCAQNICPYSQTGNLITHNTIWIGRYDTAGVMGSQPRDSSCIYVARNVGTPGDGLYDQGSNTFQDNIFVNDNGYTIRYNSNDPWLATSTYRNNIIYRVSGQSDLVRHGDQWYSWTQFQSAARPLVTGNLFADPQFTAAHMDWWNAPETFNLRLRADSPATGKGYNFMGAVPAPTPVPVLPTNAPMVTVTTTCKLVASAVPPDTTGGWKVEFQRSSLTFGSPDTTAPYTRTVSNLPLGTYDLRAIWTKSGASTVTSAVRTVVCQ